MKRNILLCILLTGVVSLGACMSSTARPPFLSENEWAIKQRLQAELSEYRDLRITVSGDRVYFSGEVPNVPDRNRVLNTALAVPGINAAFEDLYLTEVGSDLWSDPW